MRTAAFRERAAELGGYDVGEAGEVRWSIEPLLGLRVASHGRVSRAAAILPPPQDPGGMAEWLKAHAWKACIRETVSWVRIPPPSAKIILRCRPPSFAVVPKVTN